MIDVVGYGGSFQRHLTNLPHDNRNMAAASHGPRLSAGGELPHPLHAVPRENHTSVIKKLDHSVESILPSTKQTGFCAERVNSGVFAESGNNAMMDDDFSDHDSHYSEDFEDDETEELPPEPDVTRQLLDFADMVSGDIQKFFGRKKGEEDSCDIYEDKWYSAKSGREMYYADLMKIVQGEDKGGKASSSTVSSPLLDISNSVKDNKDNRNSFSGKLDKKLGVGPLNELFDYGLRHFLSDRKLKTKELKRLKVDAKKFDDVKPMQNRKLPSSFWREPGSKQTNMAESRASGGTSVLHQTNNPPDFSDLLESWRLDRSEFTGDMSSRSMSPESV